MSALVNEACPGVGRLMASIWHDRECKKSMPVYGFEDR